MKSQYGEVSVTVDGHVAVLEINRPPNNFVSVELMRDLADALNDVDADTNLRASVLAAAGKVFCAGADLASPTGVGGQGMQGINPLYDQAVRLFSVKNPIVAAIQGAAVGAGLGLALVADFRVVAPEARFAANFVKLGFHPGFGITHTLPRVVGLQKAQLMCLTGRRIKGEEALAWGVVNQVCEPGDLMDQVLAIAGRIASFAPLAVRQAKHSIHHGLQMDINTAMQFEIEAYQRMVRSEDRIEGVLAFNEKRKPVFKGR